jgi:ATP phosphoribosyltransferase regulatory subunit
MRTEPVVPADALAAIRAPMLEAGAEPVDAPILQPLNLLLDLAGEAMRARLFVVQAEGGAEACLRPDFTVAVARGHLERGAASGRYVYEGPADAEIAALAWRSAQAGGRDDLSLWLGDVGLFAAFIDSLSLPAALAARLTRVAGRPRLLNAELARAGEPARPASGGQLAALLSSLGEDQAATLLEEVWSLAGVEPVGGRGPGEIAARLVRRAEAADAAALTEAQARAIADFMAISDAPAAGLAQVRELAGSQGKALQAALADWHVRLERLTAAVPAGCLRFAPALGHAFDYYDGLTFEVRSEALGVGRPVAVGGRYDGLLARLGGASGARAVGCMVRPWRAFSRGEA